MRSLWVVVLPLCLAGCHIIAGYDDPRRSADAFVDAAKRSDAPDSMIVDGSAALDAGLDRSAC
jgi:hypothetical protein